MEDGKEGRGREERREGKRKTKTEKLTISLKYYRLTGDV